MPGTESITYIISAAIIFYFIKSLKDILKIRSLNKEIEEFKEFIEKTEDNLKEIRDATSPKQFPAEKIKFFKSLRQSIETGEECSDLDYLERPIKEYLDELELYDYVGVDPEKYFNEEDLLLSNFNIAKNSSKGSIFVGLGVLGTFVGVALGFRILGNQVNIAGQISVIDKLVPSMSLAFITSIVGMICSLLYTRFEKDIMGSAVLEISSIKLKLSRLFPMQQDVAEILRQVNFSIQNLNSGLSRNLGNVVAESIGDNTKKLFGNFSRQVDNLGNNISNRIGGVFNEIFNKEFIDDFKEIHKSLSKMNKTMLNTTNGVEKLLEDIPKYVENFERLNDTSVEIYENSEKIGESYSEFLKRVESIETAIKNIELFKEEVADMIATTNSAILKTVEVSNTNVEKHYSNLEHISRELHENYVSTGVEIQDILIQSKNNTMTMVNNTNNIIKENLVKIEEINNNLNQNMEKIYSENQTSNREFLTQLNELKKIIEHNKQVIQSEYKNMEDSQNHLKKSTEEALESYDSTISQLTEDIMEVVKDIKDMRRKE